MPSRRLESRISRYEIVLSYPRRALQGPDGLDSTAQGTSISGPEFSSLFRSNLQIPRDALDIWTSYIARQHSKFNLPCHDASPRERTVVSACLCTPPRSVYSVKSQILARPTGAVYGREKRRTHGHALPCTGATTRGARLWPLAKLPLPLFAVQILM